ncbi:MAG: CHAT domain-containing protein [Rhizonema sp. NSF051]|nr:CHAT domain-containing protein [Rhizonema sp. NSF051]
MSRIFGLYLGLYLEVQDMSLITLSACETGLGGPNEDGVEISGISYYFLNSGAKAVMASLWSVSDESTRILMENFYTNLARGTTQAPITKAQALRQAQLSLLKDKGIFNHPYYWAPFILIGNGL